MTQRKTIWEWACSYVGDPASWSARGETILEFLIENGLEPDSQVLDIGCGNLSEGMPIMDFLGVGGFVGIEPNGWLVEAALERYPDLANLKPQFLWRTDFAASELDRKFTHIVAHSVLSHAAHWQLDQLLANTRKVVDEGAVFLCSYRRDQFNSWNEEWVYPGVTTFRLQTVMAAGAHFGWHVQEMHDYRDRLLAEAPNEAHDWLKLTAVPSMAELNERRLAEEEVWRQEREALKADEEARVAGLEEADRVRCEEMGVNW